MKPGYTYLLPVIIVTTACFKGPKDREDQQSGPVSEIPICYTPKTTDIDWYSSGQKAPIIKGLEGVDLKISTAVPEAQRYFNQGLMLAYGFNHAEAARSFYEATRLDSTCAMAYWGFAYVLGPNYNAGMEEENIKRAWEASVKAVSLSQKATPKEQALIKALATRYSNKPNDNRTHLNIAYAESMKKVYDQYKSDPDIGTLYIEALMDLHPWDLYDKKTKSPKPWTPAILAVLEDVLKKHPSHHGAHHLYIHALESSEKPEKALASARLLDSLVPGAGHLLHMPSHIYINTGDYHLGSLSNIRAAAADSSYLVACHAQGTYPLAYYPHNYHFLAATATLEGNSKLAWEASLKVRQHTEEEIMRSPGWGTLQHYYTIPFYVAAKFSMWDEILSFPKPPKDLVYPKAIWHYARGMAFLGKKDLVAAKTELLLLESLSTDSTLHHLTIWDINTTADLVGIASKVLSAGISTQEKSLDKATRLLEEAVEIEDNLNYNEPPDWFFSVRHHLGAVLLKAGKYDEAENVFRHDLLIWKKNGWALTGLYQSLVGQKKNNEAKPVKAAFEESWRHADVKIRASSTITD